MQRPLQADRLWPFSITSSTLFCITAALQAFLLKAHKVIAGLRHVDIDGVELLDGGQGIRLTVGDQRALGDARFADAPAYGGGHFGVGQVDTGGVYGGFGGDDVGVGLGVRWPPPDRIPAG